jgi:hypothetical protein
MYSAESPDSPNLEYTHLSIAFSDTVIRLETRLLPEISTSTFGHSSVHHDGSRWQEGQSQGEDWQGRVDQAEK